LSQFSIVMVKSPHRRSLSPTAGDGASAPGLTRVGNALSVVKPGFDLQAKIEERETERIWLEPCGRPGQDLSFVVVFGWCYRRTSDAPVLSDRDCGSILESHRRREIIDLDDFSGNYCLLSYDHLSSTLWCCSDLWAQQEYYFGADSELVAVGSRAAFVADQLHSPIDGWSYLSMLRGTAVVPGRSVFSGVHRITCGLGLKLDVTAGTARLEEIGDIWQPPLAVSFAEARNRSMDVIARVCVRAASLPGVSADLTGGNDSRLTAAALSSPRGARLGRRVTFKVHQTEDHPDARIAKRIADAFGWSLRRFDPPSKIGDESVVHLREVAVLSDGNRILSELAKGLANEELHWADCPFLIGSVGGEFFRDRFWYQETFRIGRTQKVNYDAFMHTLSASSGVDFERVSGASISRHDHDDHLSEGYRWIESSSPPFLNTYKLDRIAIHKLLFTADHWRYSALRTPLLVYHTAEMLDVALRIPWTYRIFRRLTTSVVERMQPRLAAIPSDRGAPMRPIRLGTLGSYSRFHLWDAAERWSRHFGPARRRAVDVRPDRNLPRTWLDYAKSSRKMGGTYDVAPVMEKAEDGMSGMEDPEFREWQMILLVSVLMEQYPNLQPVLDFAHPEPFMPRILRQSL